MKTGVILMAQGFPPREDQFDQFLENLFPKGNYPETAKDSLTKSLRQIGGECPQLEIIQKQTEALSDALPVKVYLGMRLWEPSIYTAVAQAREDRMGRLIGIVLTPHYARGTVGACHAILKDIAKDMEILPIWSWATQPLLIDYWASQMKEGATVLFTAPKISQSQAGLFQNELQETIRAIQKKVPVDAHLAFHNILPIDQPATGPDLWDSIKLLRKRDELLVAPIGFTSDQMELLFTLDQFYLGKAKRLGLKWTRLPVPNENPILIACLARVVHSVL